ncbi:ethanolamine kinase A [Phytophthora cinnamomi]|uniref:ethanolamine kinase A n=1 Tax=Phytophthora cinnamomi TaxID=4785 RepID=UPI00355A5EA8|nr:ethanolamine kinase A [Phytophthora cinnamomi]
MKLTRRCVRLLQFACSLVAFILFVASYKPYYSGQYVSPAATYVILMSYSGWLYALWHTVAVETLKLSRRPKVTDCDDTNAMLETYHLGSTLYRCGNMDGGYIFAFVAVGLYMITFALSFLYRSASSNVTEVTTEVGQQV